MRLCNASACGFPLPGLRVVFCAHESTRRYEGTDWKHLDARERQGMGVREFISLQTRTPKDPGLRAGRLEGEYQNLSRWYSPWYSPGT